MDAFAFLFVFLFEACLNTCTPVDTCREYCCSEGTSDLLEECFHIVPFSLDAYYDCTVHLEHTSCGVLCLEDCRSCLDACSSLAGNVDALDWGWRD